MLICLLAQLTWILSFDLLLFKLSCVIVCSCCRRRLAERGAGADVPRPPQQPGDPQVEIRTTSAVRQPGPRDKRWPTTTQSICAGSMSARQWLHSLCYHPQTATISTPGQKERGGRASVGRIKGTAKISTRDSCSERKCRTLKEPAAEFGVV